MPIEWEPQLRQTTERNICFECQMLFAYVWLIIDPTYHIGNSKSNAASSEFVEKYATKPFISFDKVNICGVSFTIMK